MDRNRENTPRGVGRVLFHFLAKTEIEANILTVASAHTGEQLTAVTVNWEADEE